VQIALSSVKLARMRRIGLLGGMSWESSAEYYRLINEAARAQSFARCSSSISAAVGIPLVHIADASADAVRAAGLSTVGLLATAYTMEEDFYVGRLREMHGLDVLVPDRDERRLVHDVIYKELCVGVISAASRDAYWAVIAGLVDRGAQGVLLGCTEIGLLIGAGDASVPVFDTTVIHAQRAVELALSPEVVVRQGSGLS
jgi:aspartate racemase